MGTTYRERKKRKKAFNEWGRTSYKNKKERMREETSKGPSSDR